MTVINMLKGEGNWTGCFGAVVIETKTLHSNIMEWRGYSICYICIM
jgi:hypothetical protein